MVSLDLANFDALRLVRQVRSLERTRHLPILRDRRPDDNARVLRGLDLGANDYLLRADRNERDDRARAHAGAPQALHRAAAR